MTYFTSPLHCLVEAHAKVMAVPNFREPWTPNEGQMENLGDYYSVAQVQQFKSLLPRFLTVQCAFVFPTDTILLPFPALGTVL